MVVRNCKDRCRENGRSSRYCMHDRRLLTCVVATSVYAVAHNDVRSSWFGITRSRPHQKW